MDSITSGSSKLGQTKFHILQSISSESIKRGPRAIVRSVDLNEGIEIKRRYGEGSKPLFADIINQTTADDHVTSVQDSVLQREPKTSAKYSSNESSSSSSWKSIFPRAKTDRYERSHKSKSRSPLSLRRTGRVPYYRDEKRERDRLRRLYGGSYSRNPPKSYGRKSSPREKRVEHPSTRERYHRYSPSRKFKKYYRSRRSRTRSPQRREWHKDSSKDLGKESSTLAAPPTRPYIAVPVAVPSDYAAYSFLGWPSPQLHWQQPLGRHPSTSQFAPFPIWPMVPPLRRPHQPPYMGFPYGFGPPLRYRPPTQSLSKKP